MEKFIIDAIEAGGYLGIFVLMVLENVIPPVPSEVIMGVGGLLVERGSMDFWPLLIVGTIGSTVGNYFWFWLGDRWGYQRLKPFVARWGRWLTIDWQHIEQASALFRRHGQWAVFFCRCSPFVRTLISLPAGLTHMKRRTFLAYTFCGTAIWNVMLIKGGQWLGRYLQDSQNVLAALILGFLALGAIWYAWRVLTWKPRGTQED